MLNYCIEKRRISEKGGSTTTVNSQSDESDDEFFECNDPEEGENKGNYGQGCNFIVY